jgi:hypothetical protein
MNSPTGFMQGGGGRNVERDGEVLLQGFDDVGGKVQASTGDRKWPKKCGVLRRCPG